MLMILALACEIKPNYSNIAPTDTGEIEDSGEETGIDTTDSGEETGTDTADTGTEPAYDADLDGYSTVLDCNDADATVYPDATEICDGIDNDCDEAIDEDLATATFYVDSDGDGYGASEPVEMCAVPESGYSTVSGDCNDVDASTNPGAEDLTLDGIDQDCNDATVPEDTEIDEDGDGYLVGDDCDDSDPAINARTDYWLDADGDGYGDPSQYSGSACGNTGTSVANDDDCNDSDAAINPVATEVTDTVDNDCDGSVDENTTPAVDADADGYSVVSDCNDADATINPGATETFDAVDNDCDGVIDEDWQVVVEVTYLSTGYYVLNAQTFNDADELGYVWNETDTQSSGTSVDVEFTTAEYGDLSGSCGIMLNVSEGNPATDWLCVGSAIDTASASVDIWFDGASYDQSDLVVWDAGLGNGSCAALLVVNTTDTDCQP